MRWCTATARAAALALGVALGACLGTLYQDYRVRAQEDGAGEDGAGADRVVVERAGIRVSAGPPAEFPYVIARSGRAVERGRYQLFTKIRIENLRQDAVEVLWPEARIRLPHGESVGLVEAGFEPGAGDVAGPASAPVERLEAGREVTRALIPESLHTIAVDEPLIALCDGCEYRIVLPVRVAGRPELVELPFRLEAAPRKEGGVRFLFWE